MKLSIRLLLLLCFLVLGAHSYGYIHTAQYGMALTIRPAQSGGEKQYYRLKATEIEDDDDDLSSSKKHLDVLPPSAAFAKTQTKRYCKSRADNRVPFGKYFSLLSSRKYILYRVIRV
jgi:hypothetical protein